MDEQVNWMTTHPGAGGRYSPREQDYGEVVASGASS
jgi:hypothetical protein